MMNTTGANDTGTRPDRYSQKCNISEQSDSLQPSELSVVSATVHESQLYVSTYSLSYFRGIVTVMQWSLSMLSSGVLLCLLMKVASFA